MRAKAVDEAARWVVAELKDQHARWKAVSGEGAQLHASELQRRMPEACRAARFADVEQKLARLNCRNAGGGWWEWMPAAA